MILYKHVFVPGAFRKLRLPLLFLALVPSLILDGLILSGFITGRSMLAPIIETADITATLSALAASFMLLQSWLIIIYLRLRGQRARSMVLEVENGLIYRKCKLMSIIKTDWKSGYAYNDYIEISGYDSVRRTALGSIVLKGSFKVIRRVPETEKYFGERVIRRVIIPAYYKDLDRAYDKLFRIKVLH